MGHAPDFLAAAGQQEAVTIIDFGPHNQGVFGPDPTTDVEALRAEVTDTSYRGRPGDGWWCVDGRDVVDGSEVSPKDDDGTLFAQVPGSKPITDTAADLQNPDFGSGTRLSERVAANTRTDIANGKKIVVHGDDHAGKAGCAANAKMRQVLEANGANADLVAPLAWSVVDMYGLNQAPFGVTRQDLLASVTTGAERAADDTAWDATPERVVDIAVANGAQYVALAGVHTERGVALTLDEKEVIDSRGFANDHRRPDGSEDEIFAAALGAYIHTVVPERVKAGETPHAAALHAARAILYTIGLCKVIGNQDLKGWALGIPNPVKLA